MRWCNLRARVQLSVAIAHGLDFQNDLDGLGISDEEGSIAEAVWYMAFQYALNMLFSSHPFITVNPQRAIKNMFWSNNKERVVVRKLIPDYMVFLSQCKIIKDSLKLLRTAVIMIVEQKATLKAGQLLNKSRRFAWNQALKQATYVLRNSEQNAVGVMVTFGITWSYSTIRRNVNAGGLPETDTEEPYAPTQSDEDSHNSEDSTGDIRKTGVRRDLLTIVPACRKTRPHQIPKTYFGGPHAIGRSFDVPRSTVSQRQTRSSTASTSRPRQALAGPSNRTDRNASGDNNVRPGADPGDEPDVPFLEAFDHTMVDYYTLGTRPSDLALEDVLEKLKDLPDFQTDEWQASFDSNRYSQFGDVKAMFERVDSQ